MPKLKDEPEAEITYRQSRALHTRKLILDAALTEFAERGFDGASLRNIAKRADQKYQLVTYYYRTKDDLWRAVAQGAFDRLTARWHNSPGKVEGSDAIKQLREHFRLFFLLTLENTDFHQFMVQEIRLSSPRFDWVVERYLSPLVARSLPQIEVAQGAGIFPRVNPILINNLLVSAVSSLTTLSATLPPMAGVSAHNTATQQEFWNLIEYIFFRQIE